MNTPLRVYFDIQNGQILQMTGNFTDEGLKVYDSIDEQIPKYTILSERNRETFDVIELPYGAYQQEFAESNGYRVNVETKTLEFIHADPSNPDAPQVFDRPLSDQIGELSLVNEDLMNYVLDVDMRLTMVELGF